MIKIFANKTVYSSINMGGHFEFNHVKTGIPIYLVSRKCLEYRTIQHPDWLKPFEDETFLV
jgi:hypothetical protein